MATESKPRYRDLLGPPCARPPRGSHGVVLLSPKVWDGCHGVEDLAIGIACFTTPPLLTGGQTHTHTVRTPSDASSALLTYHSGASLATRGGDPPSLGVHSPPVNVQGPPPVPSAVVVPGIPHVQVPCVLPTSSPSYPDPNGLDEPPSFMGGRQ